MGNCNCLSVEQKARGVLPTRVSQLENDKEYITAEDLKEIVWADKTGEYSGVKNESVEVIVDSLRHKIEAKLLKTFEDDLKKILPKDQNGFIDGLYSLRAVVSEGNPIFSFSLEGQQLSANYYYGNVSVDSSSITEEIIRTLSNGGADKGEREYTYNTYKQRQVFSYPASFGKLSEIEHIQTGFNVMELFELVELTVGGVIYYVYISETPSTGEYTYKFIY